MTRKRGNGQGCIRERTRGGKTWFEVYVYTTLGTGKRKQICVGTTKTKTDANTMLVKALGEEQSGSHAYAGRQTVGGFLDAWLENVVGPNKRPKTFLSYEQIVRNHIRPTLGAIRLDVLTPQHVEKLLRHKREAGLSDSSVQRVRAVLRIALNRALKHKLVSRNVAGLAECRQAEPREIVPYTPEQANKLLDAVHGHRLEALYVMAVYLGLREGELLGLRWEDVDFDNKIVRPSVQLQRVAGDFDLLPLKTRKSKSPLPMPPAVEAVLGSHKAKQLEESLRYRDALGVKMGLVFTSETGTPIEPRNLIRQFKAFIAKAKLPDARFHDLRHSAGSLMLACGVPLKVISEVLRHTNIQTTANIYAHANLDLMQAAMDQVGKALQNAAPKATESSA